MGACEWAIDRACLDENHPLPDPSDEGYAVALARRNHAEDMAVHVLWALSGRQFGVCPIRVRPCVTQSYGYGVVGVRSGLVQQPAGSGLYVWADSVWSPFGCGCPSACIASGPRAVHLPGLAQEVTGVTVDGVDLLADEWVLEGDVLYRRGAPWPGQHLGKPAGEVGTWTVDYLRGRPVPAGVDILTGLLAAEVVAACGGGECRLPRSVTSTSRRGVTHEFNPTPILAAGKTGLPEVDLWLAAVNPYHLMQAPEVL